MVSGDFCTCWSRQLTMQRKVNKCYSRCCRGEWNRIWFAVACCSCRAGSLSQEGVTATTAENRDNHYKHDLPTRWPSTQTLRSSHHSSGLHTGSMWHHHLKLGMPFKKVLPSPSATQARLTWLAGKSTRSMGLFTINLKTSGLSSVDILFTDHLILKVSLTRVSSCSAHFYPSIFPPVASRYLEEIWDGLRSTDHWGWSYPDKTNLFTEAKSNLGRTVTARVWMWAASWGTHSQYFSSLVWSAEIEQPAEGHTLTDLTRTSSRSLTWPSTLPEMVQTGGQELLCAADGRKLSPICGKGERSYEEVWSTDRRILELCRTGKCASSWE
jgi:hypothetical protein